MKGTDFSPEFVFGVATSAYQIEGAAFKDGRIPSHWDTFSHTPGKTWRGETGDVACDHYHRFSADVALIAALGVGSYRFSLAWPRIVTEDKRPNPKGLAFYHRLLDSLAEHHIEAAPTLYHWDLPDWLASRGGWANRDTAGYFADYAEIVFKEFGDRVNTWMTHNEPWCTAFLSYGLGEHAPGHRDWAEAVRAAHHVLLSHGWVVQGYRGMGLDGKIGIVLNPNVVDAVTDREDDLDAARRQDGFRNRWFLDPLFRARYPEDMVQEFSRYVPTWDFVKAGDMEALSVPMDFLGVNYYNRDHVFFNPRDAFLRVGSVTPPPGQVTAMGWEVHPRSLYRCLKRIQDEYTAIPLYITENGAAYNDRISPDGRVHDAQRIEYLRDHLAAALDFIREGGRLERYYAWSLMDNFEWSLGYSKRFGLVYVDFETQSRILKDSANWYRDVARSHRLA